MPQTTGLLGSYPNGPFFDEMLTARSDEIATLIARFDGYPLEELRARSEDARRELYNLGITFTVYTERAAIDRILPFDVVPRPLSPADWRTIHDGVVQRVAALNAFLGDVYNAQRCLKDGIVPAELVLGNANFRPEMEGFTPPGGVYVHINGTDIVRDTDGTLRVLEDNARSPSGVSYVVENRHLMQRLFPDLLESVGVRSVSDYGVVLRDKLAEVAPEGVDDPGIALLTPGAYNSAYFEHMFLAREMGVPLVEGSDLVIEDDRVYMRTVAGLEPVHVLYRRLNDDFLDPLAFRPDSVLGVPGLFRAYRRGNVTLANAIGTGVADDKAVYAYVPRLIRYYLDEEPILENVETHICREEDGLRLTLDRLAELVVKPVGESGGYGITIGPKASAAELALCRERLLADPGNYVSQPMIGLSTAPTLTETGLDARHVDLRPFAITGRSTWVLPGGLTRVSLRKGSIVVNSSQGGGSKDTWVFV